jgi:hypothetical protein
VDSWITYFCSLAGHELYAEVPEDYIEDEFNLTGLSAIVPYYELALDIILNVDIDEMVESDSDGMSNDLDPSDEEGSDGLWKETPLKVPKNAQRPDVMALERYAGMLYGLIHQRYILSRNGLRQLVRFKVCSKHQAVTPNGFFFFFFFFANPESEPFNRQRNIIPVTLATVRESIAIGALSYRAGAQINLAWRQYDFSVLVVSMSIHLKLRDIVQLMVND